MSFRDREWEDLQRDCTFFPAYTDYLYGLDTRPHVKDEPGLHPQLLIPTSASSNPMVALTSSSGPVEQFLYTGISPSHSQCHIVPQDVPHVRGSGIMQQINIPDQLLHHPVQNDTRQLRASVQLGMGMSTSRPPSLQDMERRRMLNAAQHLAKNESYSPTASQKFLRDFRQLNESSQHQDLVGPSAPLELPTSTPNYNQPFTSLTSYMEHPSGPKIHIGQLNHDPICPSIQPNDLITHPQYSFIPAHHRENFNSALTKLWEHVNSHPDTNFRAECLSRIQSFSASIWEEQAKFETQEDQRRQHQQHQIYPQQQPQQQEEQQQQQHQTPNQFPTPSSHLNTYSSAASYGVTESTKLHIHASLPKLIRCLDTMHSLMTTQTQKDMANEWVVALMATLSPDAQHFVQLILQRVYATREVAKVEHEGGMGKE